MRFGADGLGLRIQGMLCLCVWLCAELCAVSGAVLCYVGAVCHAATAISLTPCPARAPAALHTKPRRHRRFAALQPVRQRCHRQRCCRCCRCHLLSDQQQILSQEGLEPGPVPRRRRLLCRRLVASSLGLSSDVRPRPMPWTHQTTPCRPSRY